MTPPAFQRIAVIDLGSNSARVIVMRFVPGYSYHLEDEIREIVRLREGMTAEGLSATAMERGLATLRLFHRFCESVGADHIIATATSAVREAANGAEFLQRVESETGLRLQILNGEQEAYYGVMGALSAVPLQNGVVLDIGGGSAQVSQVRDHEFKQGQALTLGALALTERFVHSDPIKKSAFKKVQAEIERQLDAVPWLKNERGPLVGLGGTIRTLAKIDAAHHHFPLNSINGFCLGRSALDDIIRALRELPLSQRQHIPGLVRDRADILLPGALVIRAVMERLKVETVTISESGLREGLFCEQFWNHAAASHSAASPDFNLRRFGVLNLGRFYDYQEAHARHVQHLAGRLFDQLAPLHNYDTAEREWLDAAALLHDIGTAISYHDHHKYSQTLIVANGLAGYAPREVALIALLARYHRKGTPATGEYGSLLEVGDDLRLLRLAAILRVAEYLERGRTGIVSDVVVRSDKRRLDLTLIAKEYPAVELWDTQRNATELLKIAFGRSVSIHAPIES